MWLSATGTGLALSSARCYVPADLLGNAVVSPKAQLSEIDDVELMRLVASGDRKALAALYDRFSPIMLALGNRVLGNRREAEDLLHDVFLEAWRSAKDYDRKRGTVRAWLSMRMRSRALDRVRSKGRSKVVLSEEGKLPEGEATGQDPSAAPDRAIVRQALAALPPEQRRVLELGYFQGMTSSEIAREVNIPVGTVKSRVARGLAQLRVGLGENGGRK